MLLSTQFRLKTLQIFVIFILTHYSFFHTKYLQPLRSASSKAIQCDQSDVVFSTSPEKSLGEKPHHLSSDLFLRMRQEQSESAVYLRGAVEQHTVEGVLLSSKSFSHLCRWSPGSQVPYKDQKAKEHFCACAAIKEKHQGGRSLGLYYVFHNVWIRR